jgi:hypothetical protein
MVLTVSFVLSLVTGLVATTSPSALMPFVKGTIGVHRIPFPTSVTIASRPSFGNETGRTGH